MGWSRALFSTTVQPPIDWKSCTNCFPFVQRHLSRPNNEGNSGHLPGRHISQKRQRQAPQHNEIVRLCQPWKKEKKEEKKKELSEADCLIRGTQQSNLVNYFKELFSCGIVTCQHLWEEALTEQIFCFIRRQFSSLRYIYSVPLR